MKTKKRWMMCPDCEHSFDVPKGGNFPLHKSYFDKRCGFSGGPAECTGCGKAERSMTLKKYPGTDWAAFVCDHCGQAHDVTDPEVVKGAVLLFDDRS